MQNFSGQIYGNALGDLAGALERQTEERKQKGALAQVLRKKLSIAFPDRKPEFETLGLEELHGIDEGETLKSALGKAHQQKQLLDHQLRQALEAQGNDRRLGMAWQEHGQTGRRESELSMALSPAELDRRTQPQDARSFAAAIAKHRAKPGPTEVNTYEALLRNAPRPPKGLGMGVTQKIPGVGTLVGTGEEHEPNLVPNRPPEKVEPTAGSHPWLLSDDVEEFKAGVRSLTDPKERDLVIGVRKSYEQSLGRGGFMEEFFKAFGPGASAGANGGAKPAAGKAGEPGKVTTKAQFDALPSGAIYEGKDGKRYRKP